MLTTTEEAPACPLCDLDLWRAQRAGVALTRLLSWFQRVAASLNDSGKVALMLTANTSEGPKQKHMVAGATVAQTGML